MINHLKHVFVIFNGHPKSIVQVLNKIEIKFSTTSSSNENQNPDTHIYACPPNTMVR